MAKPIDVWITPSGPNPWKFILIFEELGTPYEIKIVRFQDVKQRPFWISTPTDVHQVSFFLFCFLGWPPRSLLLATLVYQPFMIFSRTLLPPSLERLRLALLIVDPNHDNLVLWESGAVIQYIIEQYNPQRKLTYDDLKEKHLLNQWLMFQMSGQGPYFGQSGWFTNYHPERIQSATERYNGKLKRVLSVLEGHLSGTLSARDGITGSRQWLVGDKMTYADLTFEPWNNLAGSALPTGPDVDPLKEYPNVYAWHQRMVSRPAFRKVWDMRDKYMEEQNLSQLGLPVGKSYEEVMEEIEKEKREKGT